MYFLISLPKYYLPIMTSIKIRPLRPSDLQQVYALIEAAFRDDPHSDQDESSLVERLLFSPASIPTLSLVALQDDKIAGYILVSRVQIKTDHGDIPYLSMAPVAVHPAYQRNGIGGELILQVHKNAAKLGEAGIVLIGHNTYYPRFGYQSARDVGISFPFDIPEEYCMVKPIGNQLPPAGFIEYPPAFYGN